MAGEGTGAGVSDVSIFDLQPLDRFMGMRIQVVEPGTTITDNRTGQSETVPDGGAVKAGDTLYCTKAVYVRLQQEFEKLKA